METKIDSKGLNWSRDFYGSCHEMEKISKRGNSVFLLKKVFIIVYTLLEIYRWVKVKVHKLTV